jgi:MFS family permease
MSQAVNDRDHEYAPPGRNLRRELTLFLIVTAGLGMMFGIFETTFNNYLNDVFAISAEARGKLEFPRELPGFLVTLMGGVLFFLSVTRLGVLSALGIAVGTAGLAFTGDDYLRMMAFMVIWSAGNHLLMPITGTIALSLAPPHQRAARMGQIGAVGMAATIVGAIVVWAGLQYIDIGYRGTFLIAAGGAVVAAIFIGFINPLPKRGGRRPKLVLKRRYGLFYLLNVFSGARKQIFLTFGVWVLIKVFEQPAYTIAKLWIVASAIGIVFQPQLGKLIDRVGERAILMANAIVIIIICLGYGFAHRLPMAHPVWVVYVCYVIDNVIFATAMARTTYLDKIAEHEEDIHASLSVGVTIDHAVSMSLPALGGIAWVVYGYPWVFVGAATIAVLNLIAAAFIRVPRGHVDGPVPTATEMMDAPP